VVTADIIDPLVREWRVHFEHIVWFKRRYP
jgi:hypothetical protein